MIAQVLGATLLHSLWQIAVLVIALAALSPLLARISAQARYLVYCAALLSMPAIALVTFFGLYDGAGAGSASAWVASPLWHPAAASSLLARWAPWLVGMWLVGVSVSIVGLVAGCVQVKRLRHGATPLPPTIAADVERVLSGLLADMRVTARVTIAQSLAVTVPTLVGWLRPVILFPAG